MDAVKEKFQSNGSFKSKNQMPKQRYNLGIGNTRIEFSPTEGYQVDEQGNILIAEDVSDLFWNPDMTLQAVNGRSLGVYWTDPDEVLPEGQEPQPKLKGFASHNDGKTHLNIEDDAERVLAMGRERIAPVTSNVDQKAKIKAGSIRDRK